MEAQRRGYDLVEISPNANPPVCKLMDYGKYKYEQKKKQQSQKKQTSNVIKELTLSPVTQEHDLQTKIRKALSFFEDGNRVKFVVRFRGRQMAHPEIGRQQIDKIIEALKEVAQIEVPPKMEGRQLACLFAPLPGAKKAVKAQPDEKATASASTEQKA